MRRSVGVKGSKTSWEQSISPHKLQRQLPARAPNQLADPEKGGRQQCAAPAQAIHTLALALHTMPLRHWWGLALVAKRDVSHQPGRTGAADDELEETATDSSAGKRPPACRPAHVSPPAYAADVTREPIEAVEGLSLSRTSHTASPSAARWSCAAARPSSSSATRLLQLP